MYEIYVRYVRLASNDMRLLEKTTTTSPMDLYSPCFGGNGFFFQPVQTVNPSLCPTTKTK